MTKSSTDRSREVYVDTSALIAFLDKSRAALATLSLPVGQMDTISAAQALSVTAI
ncbi:MAG TPA: hypothetical protein VFU02_17385 [Polyangiaceae bacterium]|nr:hypothetical protein [Polyangiaceae bacterium]